jgi:hypothetical protein
MPFLKSAAAARTLGIRYHVLYALVRDGVVAEPPRDTSGDFVWREEDVEAARQALAARRRPSAAAAAQHDPQSEGKTT